MRNNNYLTLSLVAVAILSGCNSMSHNAALTDAHANYDRAHNTPPIRQLAPLELNQAKDSLIKADAALRKGESTEAVNHLAYMASQQVAIAHLTAKHKTAELAVTHANANRDQVRLEARTAEADAAKLQLAIVQEVSEIQANDLAAAAANSESDQAIIALQDRKLNELAANSESDQALIVLQDKQLNELKAKQTKRGLVVTLGDVLFGTNQAELKASGVSNVQKLADFLKQHPQRKVLIEGHTDNRGSNSLNQALSSRRANSVRTALVEMGINSNRVTTNGYGELFPVASNHTAADRQLNRRIEIIFSDDSGNIVPR